MADGSSKRNGLKYRVLQSILIGLSSQTIGAMICLFIYKFLHGHMGVSLVELSLSNYFPVPALWLYHGG